MEINADLTQELFLELFQKQRFDHYADNEYSSTDIENELARIEVPNLVGARLRKRYPESFRMARRVSSLLKESSRFRRFGADDASLAPRRRGRPRKDARPPRKTQRAQSLCQGTRSVFNLCVFRAASRRGEREWANVRVVVAWPSGLMWGQPLSASPPAARVGGEHTSLKAHWVCPDREIKPPAGSQNSRNLGFSDDVLLGWSLGGCESP